METAYNVASIGDLPIAERYQSLARLARERERDTASLRSPLTQEEGAHDDLLSAPAQIVQDVAAELLSGHDSTWEMQLLAVDLANMLHQHAIILEAMRSDRRSVSFASVSSPQAWLYRNPNLARSLAHIYEHNLSPPARRAMKSHVLRHGTPTLAEALYSITLRQDGLQSALRFLPACTTQFVADCLHNHGNLISLPVWKCLVRNSGHTEVLLSWIEEELTHPKIKNNQVLTYVVTKLVAPKLPGLFLEVLDREYEWLHCQKTFSWRRLVRRDPEHAYRVVMAHVTKFGVPYPFLTCNLVHRYGSTRANQIFHQEAAFRLKQGYKVYKTMPFMLKVLGREHRASFLKEVFHAKFQKEISLANVINMDTLALLDDLTRVAAAEQILLQDSTTETTGLHARVPIQLLCFDGYLANNQDYDFRLKVCCALMFPRQEAFARLMSLLLPPSHYGKDAKKRGHLLGCLFLVSGKSPLAESVSEEQLTQALELVANRFRNDQGPVHQTWLESLRTWVPPQHLTPAQLQLLLRIADNLLKSPDCTALSRQTLAQIWWSALRVGQPPLLRNQLFEAVFSLREVNAPLNECPLPAKEFALVLDEYLQSEYPWPADKEPTSELLRNFIKLLEYLFSSCYSNRSLEALSALTWVSQRLVPWILNCSKPKHAVKLLSFYPKKRYGSQKEYQALIAQLWHKHGAGSKPTKCSDLILLVATQAPDLLWCYFRGETLPAWLFHLSSTDGNHQECTWLGTILNHILQSPRRSRLLRWPHSVQQGMAKAGAAQLATSHSLQALKKAARYFPAMVESLMCELLSSDITTPPNAFVLQISGLADRPQLALSQLEPYLNGDQAKLILGVLEQLCRALRLAQADLLKLLKHSCKVTVRKQVARLTLQLAAQSERAGTWNMLWNQDDHEDVRGALILMLSDLLIYNTPEQEEEEEALWQKLEHIIQQKNPSSYAHLESLVEVVAESCSKWTQIFQQKVVLLFATNIEHHLLPHIDLIPKVFSTLTQLHIHVDLSLYDTLLALFMGGLHLPRSVGLLDVVARFFTVSLYLRGSNDEELWEARSERLTRALRNLLTPKCLWSHLLIDLGSDSSNYMDSPAIAAFSLFIKHLATLAQDQEMKWHVKLCHKLLAAIEDALHEGSIGMFTIFKPYARLGFVLVNSKTTSTNDDGVECSEGATVADSLDEDVESKEGAKVAGFVDTLVERLGGMCFLYFLSDIEKLMHSGSNSYTRRIHSVPYLQGWLVGLDALKPECAIARSLVVLHMLRHLDNWPLSLGQQSNKVGVTMLLARLRESPFPLVRGLAALPLKTFVENDLGCY